jgi:hypothetical protein
MLFENALLGVDSKKGMVAHINNFFLNNKLCTMLIAEN